MAMSEKALALIKTQIIAALVIYVVMFLLTLVMFNRKGVCRFPGIKNTIIGKLIPNEPTAKKKKAKRPQKTPEAATSEEEDSLEEIPEEALAEEETAVEYERQGEQVITVDDIVIEGLDE